MKCKENIRYKLEEHQSWDLINKLCLFTTPVMETAMQEIRNKETEREI